MDSNQVKTAAVITKTKKSYLPSFVEEPTQQGMLLDAWYKKSVWLWLLSPLSLLFSFFKILLFKLKSPPSFWSKLKILFTTSKIFFDFSLK